MSKPIRSIDNDRKALMKEITSQDNSKVVTKTVPFQNNDVPNYLEKYNEYEKRCENIKFKLK